MKITLFIEEKEYGEWEISQDDWETIEENLDNYEEDYKSQSLIHRTKRVRGK